MFTWIKNKKFKELYEEEAPFLRSYLYQIGAGQGLDDVLQETFVKVWRFLDKVPPQIGRRAYLVTMARNTLTDYYRKKNAAPQWEVLDEQQEGNDLSKPHTLLQVLSELEDDQRELIVLVCIEGLTSAEASEVFDVPEGTIKSRLHKAREVLKERLEKAGVAV